MFGLFWGKICKNALFLQIGWLFCFVYKAYLRIFVGIY